jgi:short-subunit dehydrogenase
VILLLQEINPAIPVILPLDLSDSSTISAKAQEAISIFGCVDILINNGGISFRGAILETDIDVDRRLMEVNYFGHVALTKGNSC